jgi:CBS domain-containing protein
VVANGHSFVGFVTETRLRRIAAEGGREQRVATIVLPSARTQPGDTLVHAVVTMERSGARQLGVIDPSDGNRLIGLLTMSDIVRAHARAVIDEEGRG